MANVDPTQFSALRELFPELTEAQFQTAVLFSVGFPRKEIADLRRVSNSCIEHTLNAVKEKLNIASISSLRAVFLLRFFCFNKVASV